MKKNIFILLILFSLGLILSSCGTTQKAGCPAYGEGKKFVQEKTY